MRKVLLDEPPTPVPRPRRRGCASEEPRAMEDGSAAAAAGSVWPCCCNGGFVARVGDGSPRWTASHRRSKAPKSRISSSLLVESAPSPLASSKRRSAMVSCRRAAGFLPTRPPVSSGGANGDAWRSGCNHSMSSDGGAHSQHTALATRHTATATSHHVSDSFWRAELKIPRDCDDVMTVTDLATAIFVASRGPGAQLQIVEERLRVAWLLQALARGCSASSSTSASCCRAPSTSTRASTGSSSSSSIIVISHTHV